MLVGEPFAGTANTALHFIQHQQPVVLVTDFTQLLEIMDIQGTDSAFALYGLDQYCYDIGVVFGNLMYGIQVIIWNAHKTFHQWFESRLYFAVAGGGQCSQSAAMKRFLHYDNGWIFNALLMAI